MRGHVSEETAMMLWSLELAYDDAFCFLVRPILMFAFDLWVAHFIFSMLHRFVGV